MSLLSEQNDFQCEGNSGWRLQLLITWRLAANSLRAGGANTSSRSYTLVQNCMPFFNFVGLGCRAHDINLQNHVTGLGARRFRSGDENCISSKKCRQWLRMDHLGRSGLIFPNG